MFPDEVAHRLYEFFECFLEVGPGGILLRVHAFLLRPRRALRTSIKSQFENILSIFGDKSPQNGSKNVPYLPIRLLGLPT